MMNNKAARILSLTLALGAVGSAQAVDLQYVDTVGLNIYTSATGLGYQTGEMQFVTGSGASFEAYCVELAQGNAPSDSGLVNYTVGSFTPSQASLLQGLYSSTYASVSTLQDKAAFQTAIWEIMEEPAGSALSVYTGNFQFGALSLTSTDAENIAFADKIDGYLTAATSYSGPARYTLTKMVNPQFQDYVTASAVPEPESYALLLAGLGAVGFIARRRAMR